MENEKDGIEERTDGMQDVIERAIKFELSPEQYNGNATTIERMALFAHTETATLTTQLNEMRKALREVIQVFNDLETDCRTAFPKYDSWPMADEVIAKAQQLLDKSGED